LIIPLIFEPFIDNAFKHGTKSLSDKAYIHISIEIKGDWLYFEVINNYEKEDYPADNLAHGIGLKNAKKRLSYLYGKDQYHLEITKKDNIFKVQLQLILKTTK
jgi:sensor histidine kinase YesM